MIKVAVFGVNGRMGASIAEKVVAAKDVCLSAAIVRPGNNLVGTKFRGTDLIVTHCLENDVDVIIDFTLPEGVMEHLQYAKPMVIGSTGFTEQQINEITAASEYVPILFSSNMSYGMNLCYKLLRTAGKALDNNWTVEVHDIHHVHKKDKPSGTAKEMAKILDGRKVDIASERRGDVIGEHAVLFSNELEEIVITHKAKDRDIFAEGAVNAARWINSKEPRLYSMQDMVA